MTETNVLFAIDVSLALLALMLLRGNWRLRAKVAQHRDDRDTWQGRARHHEEAARLFGRRLQDAHAEIDRLTKPPLSISELVKMQPRDARGHFVSRKRGAVEAAE